MADILGSGLIGFLGGLDIRPDSTMSLITNGLPNVGTYTRATAFTPAAWHHLDMLFNMNTRTYNVTLDSTILGTNVAFCNDNSTCTSNATPGFVNLLIDNFGSIPTAGAIPNDSGYFDNVLVQTVASGTPEPSTVFLLVSGICGIALKRRKSC